MSTLFDDLHPAETAFYNAVAGHKTWWDAAEKAMKHLASKPVPFSSDDLRELLAHVEEPPSLNAIGGLFSAWSRQGLIIRVGGGSSRGKKRNGGHRFTWMGAQHFAGEATG